MSENPAIYLKSFRMTKHFMLSCRTFTSQMSTICFLKLSFDVSDTELCLREPGHQAGRMVLGLSQQAVQSVWLFPIATHFGLPRNFIKWNSEKKLLECFLIIFISLKNKKASYSELLIEHLISLWTCFLAFYLLTAYTSVCSVTPPLFICFILNFLII